jgi:hypothetical protein
VIPCLISVSATKYQQDVTAFLELIYFGIGFCRCIVFSTGAL